MPNIKEKTPEIAYQKFLIKHLPKILDRSHDVFWIRSSDYHEQIYVSSAYETVWGRTRESLYDNPTIWHKYLLKEDFNQLMESVEKRRKNRHSDEKFVTRYRILRPDGDIRWIREQAFPLYDEEGENIGFAGIASDVTDEALIQNTIVQAKDRAEHANRVKSDFLAMMSHELRTPLNSIMGMAQILHTYDLTQEQKQYVDIIYKSGQGLLSLINDILDFAKLEAGKLDFLSEKFHLREVIEDTVNNIVHLAREKSIELVVDYDPELPNYFEGDARRVRQVLINLINNAIKFTREGYIVISANLVIKDKNKITVQFSVSDTGIGIAKDKLDTIFERFTQLSTKEHHKYDGVGLGLTITKQLVETMGGDIYVNSQENRGTVFYCNLPFSYSLEDTLKEQTEWLKFQQETRILIVDDNLLRGTALARQVNLESLEQALCKGDEVLSYLIKGVQRNEPYDIVIIDKVLISANSLEIISKIKNDKRLASLLIILMMEPSSLPEKHSLQNKGFFDFLIKPVQPSELQKTMLTAWKKWNNIKNASEDGNLYNLKVLLIEDNELNQRIATVMLVDFGCEVDIASTGKEAIEKLNNHYDLVFVDIALPDISGLEVTQHFRKKMQKDRDVPFIALTAHVQENDKEKCFEVGIDEVLTKPILREQLQDVLSRYALKKKTSVI